MIGGVHLLACFSRFYRSLAGGLTLLLIALLAVTSPISAQNTTSMPPGIPDPANYKWSLVADGFDSPLGLASPLDGTRRTFLLEQGGLIWIMDQNGEVGFEPFLDISGLLPQDVFRGGYTEQGLLGLAFHPRYASNRQFYLDYTNRDGDTVIARYLTTIADPNVADPDSEQILLTIDQPHVDHNGGQIAFGSDGYLYIAMGDGGDPDDPSRNGQKTDILLGKLLRIDVNSDTYTVPPDNPFVGNGAFLPEIWAYGLRNPWRFSFDRATGELYIGDVGQWDWEEVNVQPAGQGGQNYGWSAFQATHPYLEQPQPVDESAVTMPVLEYAHTEGCSVTGGYVYRGGTLLDMQGVYLYGDYCNGRVWAAKRDADGVWQHALWMQTNFVISSFGQDEVGEIYLVDYKGGISRLSAAG
ncbi:MAG: PQQ-dependent sugar dehydrogenase [Anaerolineae bacterium]